MNRMRKSVAVLAAAAGLALAGCGTMTVNPIAQFVDDSATTTAIKSRLATEAGLGSMTGIGVRTSDDVVWLTGTVSDEAERQRVEAIARRIAGDNRVVSELSVANTASASPSSQKPTAQK
jgi:hyperosmotically inducible periplasmic protein